MNAASILSFIRSAWDFIKKVFRTIVKFAQIIIDLAELCKGISPFIEKGIGIFKRTLRLFKVAVKDGNNVVECICEPNGTVVDYENHSQIIQGERFDSETEAKFRNENDVIEVEM